MAYIRKRGKKWQATVRHPSGRRISETHDLRSVVADWARDLESEWARGSLRDPRAGKITISEWHDRWSNAHVVADTTRTKNEYRWRVHCQPKWGSWPLEAITRMEAQGWVRELEVTPRRGRRVLDEDDAPYLAPWTIHGVVGLMTSLCRAATEEIPPLITSNPFAKLSLPTIPPSQVIWYTHEQVEAVIAAMRRLHPERWAVMADLAAHVGLRYGELAGLAGDRVDWLRHEIHVTRVWTIHGLREYPKSAKSHRVVPVPERIIEEMSRLMQGRGRAERVFAGSATHAWHSEWHRMWYSAISIARTCWDGKRHCKGEACAEPEHAIPHWPPHSLRHTAASWLVMDGVDLYRVQAFLGHESFRTTQRYSHLAPAAHDRIREVWNRRTSAQDHDAAVTPERPTQR